MVSDDRGTAGLLLVGGALVAAAVVAAGALVAGVVAHSRVEAAADMVALAAAGRMLLDPQPCDTAARVAGDNDVHLAGCDVDGLAVSVTIEADLPPVLAEAMGDRPASARARAELVPRPHPS